MVIISAIAVLHNGCLNVLGFPADWLAMVPWGRRSFFVVCRLRPWRNGCYAADPKVPRTTNNDGLPHGEVVCPQNG